jgi:hypothetical protein
MAVLLEFSNVIALRDALETRISGGLDRVASLDLPNWAEDDHLVRIGFMSTAESLKLVTELSNRGISCAGAPDDGVIAIVELAHLVTPTWLNVGTIDGAAACWRSGTEPGPLVRPEPGFMLELGPRSCAIDDLAAAVAAIGATLVPGPEHASYRCQRGEASVDTRLIECDDGRAIVWVTREINRRRHFAEEVALLRDFRAHILAMGATEVTRHSR